jgi:hypothetical protein
VYLQLRKSTLITLCSDLKADPVPFGEGNVAGKQSHC